MIKIELIEKKSKMTCKGNPIQHPKNKIDINKDKFTVKSCKDDIHFKRVLPNMKSFLTPKVIEEASNERHEHPVIHLGGTRTFYEKQLLKSDETQVCKKLCRAHSSKKCIKSNGTSQRLRHRKHIGAANRKHYLCLYSLSMACVFFSISKAVTVLCADIVSWEVKTKPILFGETLEILCKILDETNLCQGSFQQWYGSKKDILLCQNGKCRNEKKYTVRQNANCSYSLLIHNLSLNDVDISYSCAFGINEMKKGLMMKDYEFLKLPKNNSLIPIVTTNDSIVDVLLKMDGIYPEPKCTVQLNKGYERDITNKADISFNVTQEDIFYTYEMHIIQNVSNLECGSLLSVHCLIGSFNVTTLSKELDACTDFTSITLGGNNMTAVAPTISLPIIGVVIVICVVVFGVVLIISVLYHKRKNRRRNHGNQVKGKKGEVEVGYASEYSGLHTINPKDIDLGYTRESSCLQIKYPAEIYQKSDEL